MKVPDVSRTRVIARIKSGDHPRVALTAEGFGKTYYRRLQHAADGGDESAKAFCEEIETAEALAESNDVITTKRAATVEQVELTCPECDTKFRGDPVALAETLGAAEAGQRIKAMAHTAALQRLERRYPKRWSLKVTHTVEEEHTRLLDVAQRILAPEVFDRLLEAYIASESGAGETADGSGGTASGGVH